MFRIFVRRTPLTLDKNFFLHLTKKIDVKKMIEEAGGSVEV